MTTASMGRVSMLLECNFDMGKNTCMSFRRLASSVLALLVFSAMIAKTWAVASAQDLLGSHDSPIVSRFAGSVITGYLTSDYDKLTLPLGKVVDGTISHTETVEGRVTRIAYLVPKDKSALEVWRNFQDALANAGFQTRFSCNGNDGPQGCGDDGTLAGAVTKTLLDSNNVNGNGPAIASLYPTNGTAYLETARLTRPSGPVDVVLMVIHSDEAPVGVLLQICEGKAMATGEVTVNAKAMGQGLAQNGHIALYGIHFATDSATLTKDSDATLAQMVALLKSQPALKVYIVGHTDNTGTLTHNLTLSQQRADAVVKALTARGRPYGGQGAGILCSGGEQSERCGPGAEPPRRIGRTMRKSFEG